MANDTSIGAKATQWNARSHEANQGCASNKTHKHRDQCARSGMRGPMSKPGLRIKQNAQTQRSVRNCLCMASPEHSNVAGAYIFPLVGHADNVATDHVRPGTVACVRPAARDRRPRHAPVARKPTVDVIVKPLLAPQKPRICLPVKQTQNPISDTQLTRKGPQHMPGAARAFCLLR